ncbi:MAG: hypothetical protein K1W24_08880 [Lachnospiraceae bacterium]
MCTSYETPNYTKEMQEFLAKTTDDFEQEKVLNLDNDKTNNFAVYNDKTIIIPEKKDVNKITKSDNTNLIYVIENADTDITSLQKGDIFSYKYNGEVLVVKIASITKDGTTVTITGENTSLEEVFDYVKIDTKAGTEDVTVDTSKMEEGLIYNGLVDDSNESRLRKLDVDESISKSLSYDFSKLEFASGNVKISGSMELKLNFAFKINISLFYQYCELKVDYIANINAYVTGEINPRNIPLGYIALDPVPGIGIGLIPYFTIEASGKIELNGKLSGTVGAYASTETGLGNLTTTPQYYGEISGAVTKDGSLYMWGSNSSGQLGDGTKENKATPVKVLDNVASVSLGSSYSGAVTKNGSLYMWGYNYYGQLGNKKMVKVEIPVPDVSYRSLSLASANNSIRAKSPGMDNLYTAVNADTPLKGAAIQSKNFTGLLPNAAYNFYILKSRSVEKLLSPDNLLYLKQYVSDSNGNINVTYQLNETSGYDEPFVVGMSKPNLSDAQIEVPDLIYNGAEQYIYPKVSYKGNILSEGDDYIVSGDFNVTEAGDYLVKISGTGLYTGEVTKGFSVKGTSTGTNKPEVSSSPSVKPSGGNSPSPSPSTKPSGSGTGGSTGSGGGSSAGGGGGITVITPTPAPATTLTPSPSPVTTATKEPLQATSQPEPSASLNPGSGADNSFNSSKK